MRWAWFGVPVDLEQARDVLVEPSHPAVQVGVDGCGAGKAESSRSTQRLRPYDGLPHKVDASRTEIYLFEMLSLFG